MDREELKEVVKEAMIETLVGLGIQASDPMEMQRDHQFLREIRLTAEKVKTKGILVSVGVLVTGLLGLLGIWIKSFFD